jgi:hypothetical protein
MSMLLELVYVVSPNAGMTNVKIQGLVSKIEYRCALGYIPFTWHRIYFSYRT